MKVGLRYRVAGTRVAHLGVLKVLGQSGIPIDLIAGVSAGIDPRGRVCRRDVVDEIISMSSRIAGQNSNPSVSVTRHSSNAPMGAFLAREFPVTCSRS